MATARTVTAAIVPIATAGAAAIAEAAITAIVGRGDAVLPVRPLLLLCLTSLLFAGAGYPGRPARGDVAPPGDQTREVVASRSGFTPSVIEARKGETLHLRLTSRDQEHCFAVEAFRIEKRVVPGRTTTVDITPDRAGTFPYYCCLESGAAADAERGRLIVAE